VNLQALLKRGLRAQQAGVEIADFDAVGAAGDLPEARRVHPGLAAERFRADAARLVHQDLQADLGKACVQAIAHARQIQRAGDEQVPDPEARIGRQRGAQADAAQAARPQLARDVGLHSRAVAFAVDKAGAVAHVRQRAERSFQRAISAFAALAHAQDQRA